MTILNNYYPNQGILHRSNAKVKIIGAFFTILAIALIPYNRPTGLSVLALLLILLTVLSGVPHNWVLRRLAIILPVLVFCAVGLLYGGDSLNLINFSSRIILAAWCGTILFATTKFGEILSALNAMKLSSQVVTLLYLSYRIIHDIASELTTMTTAARCRAPNATIGAKFQMSYFLSQSALHRLCRRITKLEDGLLSRGFYGRVHLLKSENPSFIQILVLSFYILLIVIYVTASIL